MFNSVSLLVEENPSIPAAKFVSDNKPESNDK